MTFLSSFLLLSILLSAVSPAAATAVSGSANKVTDRQNKGQTACMIKDKRANLKYFIRKGVISQESYSTSGNNFPQPPPPPPVPNPPLKAAPRRVLTYPAY
jgi:hypothetical protein